MVDGGEELVLEAETNRSVRLNVTMLIEKVDLVHAGASIMALLHVDGEENVVHAWVAELETLSIQKS